MKIRRGTQGFEATIRGARVTVLPSGAYTVTLRHEGIGGARTTTLEGWSPAELVALQHAIVQALGERKNGRGGTGDMRGA
jgi:hypothetical protein